jgi:hypothetical protein
MARKRSENNVMMRNLEMQIFGNKVTVNTSYISSEDQEILMVRGIIDYVHQRIIMDTWKNDHDPNKSAENIERVIRELYTI